MRDTGNHTPKPLSHHSPGWQSLAPAGEAENPDLPFPAPLKPGCGRAPPSWPRGLQRSGLGWRDLLQTLLPRESERTRHRYPARVGHHSRGAGAGSCGTHLAAQGDGQAQPGAHPALTPLCGWNSLYFAIPCVVRKELNNP